MPTQFQSIVALAELNGQNGFRIEGELKADNSGSSLNAKGDINGDGINDLLVGSPGSFGGYGGRSYLIFGDPDLGKTGFFNLTQLNGVNGVTFTGASSDDNGGYVAAEDLNGDAHPDLLIGATGANRAYVVFGGPANLIPMVVAGGVFSLPSVNGVNGFIAQGPTSCCPPYLTGASLALADINADGRKDLMVADAAGALGGFSFVLFGRSGVSSATINLFSLDGVNGFRTQTSAGGCLDAGDINGDAIADMLLGASLDSPGGITRAGQTYVLFGGSNINGGNAIVNVALNGTNGFTIEGEIPNSYSGSVLSAGGDINGDGYTDILIGAPADYSVFFTSTNPGHSYVVFGGSGVGANGSIPLSELNGLNGFKIFGEAAGDGNGQAVKIIEDINGDAYSDLLIGAPGISPKGVTGAGRTYVVFGGPNIGRMGYVALSNLNGTNGFKLDGVSLFEASGSAFGMGDINGDEFIDIAIGAAGASTDGNPQYGSGRSYIVFGDISPTLYANELTIHPGERVTLTAQNLNVTDNHPLSFVASNIQHGQFELVSAPGQNITRFNQSELFAGQVQFVHDGSFVAPSYLIQPINDGIAASPLPNPANITFYLYPPVLHNNQLIIHQGESVLLTPGLLNVTDDYPATQVVFNMTNVQHGQFEFSSSRQPTAQFTEQQLLSGDILFVHDNSSAMPAYAVSVSDPYYYLAPSDANITYYHRPVWINNQIPIEERGAVFITSAMLAVDAAYPDDQVIFSVSTQHGQFEWSVPANGSVLQFSQAQAHAGQIQFRHDGSESAPSYSIAVNDPYFSLAPIVGTVNYLPINDPPFLLNNRLFAVQGRSQILNPLDLSAGDMDSSLPDLIFTVSEVQHGNFHLIQNAGPSISQFTQSQIESGQVEFTTDGTRVAPAYQVSVSDGSLSSPVQSANVTLDTAPGFINNRLSLSPGETVVMDITSLKAVDDFTPPSDLIFTISNLQHGYFAEAQDPSIESMEFTQGQISGAEIQFISDGSRQAPVYWVTVTDQLGLTATKAANVTLTLPVSPSSASSNSIRNTILGVVISAVASLGIFGLKLWLGRKASEYFERASQDSEEGVAKQQADFHKNVIKPIARRLLDRVNMTGFLGYISDQTMKESMDVIAGLVRVLQQQGVEVDLTKMDAAQQNHLLNVIARQARQILVPEVGYCSLTYYSRFFCPDVTPTQIESKSLEIAAAVKRVMDAQKMIIEDPSERKESGREGIELASDVLTGRASPAMFSDAPAPLTPKAEAAVEEASLNNASV